MKKISDVVFEDERWALVQEQGFSLRPTRHGSRFGSLSACRIRVANF